MKKKLLTKQEINDLLVLLKERFDKNVTYHKGIIWSNVENKLINSPSKLWSLNQMEATGGEPDVLKYDEKTDTYIFYDTSIESPSGRRSLCYDRLAFDLRKKNKPTGNVIDACNHMGVELLTNEDYHFLQTIGDFDNKTSSWIKTPERIRKLGGALFCDYRYQTVFTYHNGADSYYGSRGFRCLLKV